MKNEYENIFETRYFSHIYIYPLFCFSNKQTIISSKSYSVVNKNSNNEIDRASTPCPFLQRENYLPL